jgi:protein-S-isoprenylcysteine O-methyltransferase Ste14
MSASHAETRKGVARWVVKQVMGMLLALGVSFAASGRFDWIGGWLMFGLFLVQFLGTLVFLIPRSPGLYAERSRLQKGTKGWDNPLAILVAYGVLYTMIVGGLNARWGWTSPWPLTFSLVMAGVTLLGMAFTDWALMANPFFAATVRIQEDRGQTVVTTGPYRYIRHPGYAGATLSTIGIALMMGTPWCLVPLGVFLAAVVVRTALEDRTLRAELAGYADYCTRTRYRLLPGIW